MHHIQQNSLSPNLYFKRQTVLSKNIVFMNQVKEILNKKSYFYLLDKKDQDMLIQNIKIKNYSNNQIIAHQNSDFNNIFIFLEGSIKVRWTTDGDKSLTETFLINSEIYNIIPVVTEEKLIYNYTSHGKSKIAIIPGDIFCEALKRNYEATYQILKLVSQRFNHLLKKNYQRHNFSLKVNLALEILKLIENYQIEQNQISSLPIRINQENLAELLNTTRQKINKELNWFAQENILYARYNKIEILDYNKLVDISKYQHYN
ncbi:Crp/Fnr family transcriptional regulator [Acinetobacter puyangensis]|uniref:Crp/Fnr family transcriptional regulator n=1 Tax=Acinetobacter puyangensis TaxID=1096779 RepID=UPI003A4DFF24